MYIYIYITSYIYIYIHIHIYIYIYRTNTCLTTGTYIETVYIQASCISDISRSLVLVEQAVSTGHLERSRPGRRT